MERYATRPGDLETQRDVVEREIRKVEQELSRLVDARAAGESASVTKGITDRERKLSDLKARAEHLDGLALALPKLDGGTLAAELRKRLEDWKGLLARQPVRARQILRKLLAGRITFEPTTDGYRFTGHATYGKLLSGIIPVQQRANPAPGSVAPA